MTCAGYFKQIFHPQGHFIFQNTPFRQLTYSILGDEKGPTFFQIDSEEGRISVRSDLTKDGDTEYKLRVQVSDGGDPPCVATAVVAVTVRRNLNDPEMDRSEWKVEILETQSLTEPIVRLEAEDEDNQHPHDEFTYQLHSSSQYKDYFSVDGNNGNVFLRRSIVGETLKEYEVSGWRFTSFLILLLHYKVLCSISLEISYFAASYKRVVFGRSFAIRHSRNLYRLFFNLPTDHRRSG